MTEKEYHLHTGNRPHSTCQVSPGDKMIRDKNDSSTAREPTPCFRVQRNSPTSAENIDTVLIYGRWYHGPAPRMSALLSTAVLDWQRLLYWVSLKGTENQAAELKADSIQIEGFTLACSGRWRNV